MKELVEKMAPKLSASPIRDYMNIVKSVVASAINENGEEIFPRKWNDQYIDAPLIDSPRQPSTAADSLTALLASVKGRYRMLYALLAGCGPLRAGKALGLEVGKHYLARLPNALHHSEGQARPDSALSQDQERHAGSRPVLATMLKEFVNKRTAGLLFQTSSGAQLLQSNILRDSLHPH
jgi:hypothetical protein